MSNNNGDSPAKSRRSFLKKVGGVAIIAPYLNSETQGGPMPFSLPSLPYAFDALEPHIDAQTMQIHHDKHHAAYVKNVNDALTTQDSIEDVLKNLTKLPDW